MKILPDSQFQYTPDQNEYDTGFFHTCAHSIHMQLCF